MSWLKMGVGGTQSFSVVSDSPKDSLGFSYNLSSHDFVSNFKRHQIARIYHWGRF
jgi:hypothetical protein